MSDSLLVDQRRRWEQGDCVPVESYLTERPNLRTDAEQILELIEHEITLREERGDKPQLAEYLRRFPDLARDLRLHFEVHAALQSEAVNTYIFPHLHPEADGPVSGDRPTIPGYEVLEELGRGGMGVVYKARQLALNRVVALKMILAGPHAGPQEVARFRREAEAVAQLTHSHIVQIYDVGEYAGRPYLALEYVDGGSLDQRTAHTPQAPEAAARLVEALAAAMHGAHQRGIIHRDLKPANVLLAASNSSQAVALGSSPTDMGHYEPKISDFGLAKLLSADSAGPTQSGDILGTPCYMAPEQAEGKSAAIGPAADIWALGVILYELLTGRPPFQAASALDTLLQVRHQDPVSPSRLQPKLPRDLVTICLTCLSKEPRKRYASALALAEDLHRFLEGKPIRARPTNAVERTVKWVRRRPAIAALLATIVVVAALGFAGVVWQLRQTEDALKKAQEAEKITRGHLYTSQIARAQHELRANHVHRAELLLQATEPEARGWEYEYLKQQCQTSLFVLRGNGRPVQAVAYSPDGRLLASGSGEWYPGEGGAVTVWNAQTGQPLWTQDFRTVYGVAFHRDGQQLASACDDGKVRLHDARTGQQLGELVGHTRQVYCVAFSPDGRYLASSSADSTVRLWDVTTGTIIRKFSNHKAAVFSVAFSPDGLRLASGDWTGIAHLWDPHSGTVLRSFDGFRDCRAVAFSPDGSWLALGFFGKQLAIWDLKRADAAPIVRHPNAGPILSLVFTPNGGLAWSTAQGIIKIQDVRLGLDRYVFRGHEDWAYAVAVHPDGRRLASSGRDGTIRIHDATSFEAPPIYIDYPVQMPGFMADPADPEHRRFLALGFDITEGGKRRELHVWSVAANEGRQTAWSLLAGGYPSAMAGTPDGRLLAWVESAQEQCRLRVRERAGKADVWSQELDAGPVTGFGFSPDNRSLAWGGKDGMIRLLDAATGRAVRTLGPHGCAVTGVSFHPEGHRLATAGEDGTFCIWDLTSSKLVKQFNKSERNENPMAEPNPKTNIIRITFSPDGRRLAAANPRWPLEIWDVEAGRVTLVLALEQENNDGCWSAAWSADGRRLAAAYGVWVKIWDATERTLDERRQATEGSALAWHRNEANWAEHRRDWFAAAYHLGKLIDAEPLNANHYARRATFRACLAESGHGRWEDAAADTARAVFLNSGNPQRWYQHALLTLATGDRARYRVICEAMLARFGQTNDATVANSVAWACSLGPDAVADPSRVVALARRALAQAPGNVGFLNTLGAALYRAGDFPGAHQRLGQAVKVHRPKENVWDWLLLAMIHHQLGQPHDAQRWLDQAVHLLDCAGPDRPLPGTEVVLPWDARLDLRLLREEATSLLHPK